MGCCRQAAREWVPAMPLLLMILVPLGQSICSSPAGAAAEWVNHGGGILNHRSAMGPGIKISRATVGKLGLRWSFPTGFNVSATPSISKDGAIYFPGWNGNVYALDSKDGRLLWQSNLSELLQGTGLPYPASGARVARATPVIHSHMLLVGLSGPAVVLALHRLRGTLIWHSQPLDANAAARITMSGTAFEGYYFVGVSSTEENEVCCSFQGSFQKLDLQNGEVIWKTMMMPKDSGYYGAAIWGSSPPIDKNRRMVYIGTGNNYRVPRSVEECESNRSNNNISELDPCISPDNHQDALVALNIDSGAIVWSRSLQAYDVWTVLCQYSPTSTPNCPIELGPDYDFGEAPMLLYFDGFANDDCESKLKQCLVVAGQKSGIVWALDCDNGTTIWSKVAGPGGSLGGASWGMCTDGERVYTNIINNLSKQFVLSPSNSTTTGGGWVGLDGQTGSIIWSVAEPTRAFTPGPVSCTNGLVFGTALTENGDVYALDALSGSILWHATTDAHIYGGFSIDEHCVYGGNGQKSHLKLGVSVSAFCVS